MIQAWLPLKLQHFFVIVIHIISVGVGTVITSIPKAMIFINISLFSMVPREGIELPITVQMKNVLLSFAS